MTTFNGGRFLRKQLDSILHQSLPVDEIVVGDDGSTDETLEILKEYAAQSNLRYFSNSTNLGFVRNFEKTLSQCTGDLIFLADQDDLWYPEKMKILVESIGDSWLIHSDCQLIDENDQLISLYFKGKIGTHKNGEDFLFANVVTGCTALIDRKLLELALPFPQGILYHDWYLGLLAAYHGKITYYPEALLGYRQHALQDTGSGAQEKSSILRNCLKRIQGKEFSALLSTRRQLINLEAIEKTFSKDILFEKKRLEVIRSLKDYLDHFFHFKYGSYYAHRVFGRNRSLAYKIFLQLKFSLG